MKPHICAAVLAVLTGLGVMPRAAYAADEAVTYVIPIKGMIERALTYVVRRGVTEAVKADAEAIIFDMDTPGGRLDATEELIALITDIRPTTYTFVNPNAISAGAITAMATDHIYMAPNGRIGDAMPIMMSPLPFGGPQEMPEGLKEKAISPTVALIRSAAQRKGHDPGLAEAMVRPELEYKVGDTVICPAGQLLTLTSADAERPLGPEGKPLLSEGTVGDLDALLGTLGLAGSKVVYVEESAAEGIARAIDSFPLSGILLALGLLGLYIEFKTPGFGLPGVAGLTLLAIWFWGHHVAGLAGMGEIVLFFAGVVLLFVELFVTPGFGLLGASGMTLIVISLILAMIEHYPGGPWYEPPVHHVRRSIMTLGFALIVVFGLAALLGRFLPKTWAFQKLVLETSTGVDHGYRAAAPTDTLVNLRGTAGTALHPAGIGVFGNKRLNVVARGAFIERGTPIIVAETHGNRIVVDVDPDQGSGHKV